MPFKSEQQRKFLWAAHPDIAKRWAHEYPTPKNLPKRVSDTPERDKQAHSASIITPEYVNTLLTSVIFQASSEKQGNCGIKLNVPHSEKPVAAGDEHVTTGNKRRDKQRQDGSASIERLFGLGDGKKVASSGAPEYCVNPLLLKLAVVLSQPIQQALADEQAQQQGQQAQQVPANGGIQPLTTPLSANPLPLGAQQQAQPPQPGQPAQQVPTQPPQQVPVQPAPQDGQPKTAKLAGPLKPMSMPKPAAPTSQAPPVQPAEAVPPAPAMPAQKPIPPLKPLGGGSNPSANPINAFGPISMSGDINGNAALGVPGAGKMAASIRESIGGFLNNKNENSSVDSKWGLMGGSLVTAPAALANMAYGKMVMPNMFKTQDLEGYKKMLAVAKAEGVGNRSFLDPIRSIAGAARRTTNPVAKWLMNSQRRGMHKSPGAYDFMAQEIITNPKYRSPAVVAHELGHHRGGKALGVAGLAGKNLMGLGTAGALWSGDENTSKNFALGGTASAAPMMASELDASWRGMRAMQRAGLKGGLRAFGGVPTYAAVAAAPMLAHYGKKYFGGFKPAQKTAAAGILESALTKWALDVTKGGLGSRALASTIGHVGAFPMMTIMSPRSHVNPNQWAGPNGSYLTSNIGKDDTRAQKLIELAKAMKSKNPEELKDHRVYLGGGDFFRELPRIFTNPRTSIAGKALGMLSHPINTLLPALTRGSIYNPFTNSTYLMGDKPSVLTHELGHAIDFNSGKVPQYSDKENPASTWLKRQGSGLKHDLYAAGRAVPLYGAFHALRQEEQANTLSADNLRKAFKHNPKALNKILDERQRILPAGMGSYAGTAAAALTSPILGPAGYMIMPTAGMLAGKAWGESESQRRDGKYVRETKQKKKPEKKKDDKEQDDDRQEPRRKAAQAVSK